MTTLHNLKSLKARRRDLRQSSTVSEKLLWNEVRNSKLGFKFKRQHSVGGYILDFYCSEKKIIIELDGDYHNKSNQKEYDVIRDLYFKNLSYKVMRFKNEEVEKNIDLVINKIKKFFN